MSPFVHRAVVFLRKRYSDQHVALQRVRFRIDWGLEVENALPIAIIWLTKAKYAMNIGLLC